MFSESASANYQYLRQIQSQLFGPTSQPEGAEKAASLSFSEFAKAHEIASKLTPAIVAEENSSPSALS